MSKKESFIKGTIILAGRAGRPRAGSCPAGAAGAYVERYRDASFTIANNVYLMLLTVATAGIPSTLSKMVSERHALNKPAEARRVYHLCAYFAGAAGVVMTLALYFGAPYYATHIAKRPEAAAAIQALAPALFPAIAMMRDTSRDAII